jgi:hypothetical protein
MTLHRHKFFLTIILFLILGIIGCNSSEKNKQNSNELKEERVETNSMDSIKYLNERVTLKGKKNIDTLEIIVVQCSNGYEYAMHNYDFNPIIENELNKFDNITVKPFPLKTLMGVSYQGVFDKKYCQPIIDKVDVDFLILTRFDERYMEQNSNKMKWGYELRIVNTKTLEQVNTISAYGLNDYLDIEKHIQKNIEKLKKDIEKLI